MNIFKPVPNGEDMPMRLSSLFHRDRLGGVPALFRGRRAAFSFNTRVAIRAACDLLGLRPGDEVLAPAFNCGSELDPLVHAGLTVRFYPVDRQTHVDPVAVEAMITAKTKAVYLIHYFGFLQPATAALRALCDERGLFLLEDCALSLLSGTEPPGGQAGDVSLFCFYKFFPTIGGGALVINNDRIAGEVAFRSRVPVRMAGKAQVRAVIDMVLGVERRRALLGWLKRNADDGFGQAVAEPGAFADMPGHYYFDPRLLGARISALTARQIGSFDVKATIARRRANYLAYLAVLEQLPEVRPLFPELPDDVCPLSMPVLVEDRDAMATALQARDIAATPWWAGYNRHFDFTSQDDACYLKNQVLSLPVHQYLDAAAPAHVVNVLRQLVRPGSSAPKAGPDRSRTEAAS